MTEHPCIEFKEITVKKNGKRLLDRVDLQVRRGDRVAVLGASGSGKTTLLRVICGLEDRLAQGSVLFDGTVVSDMAGTPLPPYRRRVAMVFQDLALWPHMTVAQHLGFVLGAKRPNADVAERRIAEAIASVNLSGRGRSRPAELSGGEQQRLALARAIIAEPQRLLLDEPFSSLDIPLRGEMIELVLKLHERWGFTLVHVTHDPLEAVKLTDTIIYLDQGRVAWSGTSAELAQNAAGAPRVLADSLKWWRLQGE